jgi:5-methylcytosine-specific restriction endonuclease McrA
MGASKPQTAPKRARRRSGRGSKATRRASPTARADSVLQTAPRLRLRISPSHRPETHALEAYDTGGGCVSVRVRDFGRHLRLDVRSPYSLDFLYSERLFLEFSQLHASLEIFIRALRGAAFSIPQMGDLEPLPLSRHLAKQGCVSSDLVANRRFCEHLKLAARICVDARVPSPALAKRIREEMGRCYMCGRQLTQKGDDVDRATVEHLWPLSLGGSSDEGNLIAACKKCNGGRENSVRLGGPSRRQTTRTM